MTIRRFICSPSSSVDFRRQTRAGSPRTWPASDEVRRDKSGPRRQGSSPEADERSEAEHHTDEKQLTDLDADIEKQERHGNVACGKADLA